MDDHHDIRHSENDDTESSSNKGSEDLNLRLEVSQSDSEDRNEEAKELNEKSAENDPNVSSRGDVERSRR